MEYMDWKPFIMAVPVGYRYVDILLRNRPKHENDLFSRRHPKMSRVHRAKIFAPFAALEGFDDRVRRKEVTYVPKAELDADEEWELNEMLYQLHLLTFNSRLARTNLVRVAIVYFSVCTDPENDAYGERGTYKTVTGIVQKVDREEQTLVICSGDSTLILSFEDIYRIIDPRHSILPR